MYGMIHRALRQMVVEQAGAQAWQDIEAKTGACADQMVSVVVYDDAKTQQIIEAVAERLGLTPSEGLQKFGRFWIDFIQCKSFAAILKLAGKDLVSVLRNLDRVHGAVLAAMPDARVPSFTVTANTDGEVDLRYRSTRVGLEPFITGLLQGLLEKFSLDGSVETLGGGEDGVRFRVRYTPRAA